MTAYREVAEHAWTGDSTRLIATPSAFARSALYYVLEIGHFRTLPAYFTEREQLDSYLVVYTVSGKGILNYHGRTYSLTAGQVFFIDCMQYQHYRTAHNESWELLWVHFNGSSTRCYYEQFATGNEPVTTLHAGARLPAIIRQLIELQRHKSYRTELIGSQLLVELLTELQLAAWQPESPATELPDFIIKIMQELDQQYQNRITLDSLAKRHAVSKSHMVKEFKRYTGFTPGEYLITARINRAKELLKYSDLSISDIAGRVGVDNVSHFINLFRDRVEQTPLAYRKKWQPPRL